MTMIERVVLAIWPDYEDVTEEMRSRVRMGIAAMREPTEKMIGAIPVGSFDFGTFIWQAMIDEALKEEQS